ncbi:MAG: C39 family peptidase [Peptococcaceae bacterium]
MTYGYFIKVPLTHQATNYTCGAAALQSVLYYYGVQMREKKVADSLDSNPAVGTEYQNIADLAAKLGFRVEIKLAMSEEALQEYISREIPVIILIQAWAAKQVNYQNHWGDEHYVVAVGFDEGNYYFMDPYTLGHYTYFPRSELLKRWHGKQGAQEVGRLGLVFFPGNLTGSYNPQEILRLE